MILHNSNPLFTTSQHVRDICNPLFLLLGINYLSFYRVYADGQRIRLTTNPHWAQHYYQNDYYKYGQIERHPHMYESGVALWDHWPRDTLGWKIVGKDAQENFDIDHGFSIVKHRKNYIDVFELTAPAHNPEVNNVYLRHLDSIHNFISYFYSRAESLIHQCERHKIASSMDDELFFKQDESGLFKRSTSFGEAGVKSKGTVLEMDGRLVTITKREMDALKHILRGKTSKEAAHELAISHRTLEDYIRRVKEKTGTKSRSELYEKIGPLVLCG